MSNFVRMGNKYADPVTGNMMTVTGVRDGIVSFDNDTNIPVSQIEAYRFLGNNTPDEIPEGHFDVVDGRLRYDGSDIKCGTLRIREIVAPCSRGVTVLVEGKDSGVDLKFYDLYNDRFVDLIHVDGNIHTLWRGTDVDCALLLRRRERPVKVGEEEFVSVTESVVIVNSGEVYDGEWMREANLGGSVEAVFEEETENGKIIVLAATSDHAFIKKTDEDGNTFFVEGDGRYVTRQFVIRVEHQECGDEFSAFMRAFGTDEKPVRLEPVHDGFGSLVIVTEGEIVYTNVGYNGARRARGKDVVKTFIDHRHLVRLEAGDTINTFVLCNDSHEIVKITVTKTRDRGYVTEIV